VNRPGAVLLAAVGIVFLWTVTAASDLHLVIKSEREETLWSLRAPLGSRVILEYVNSLYLAPTQEHFTVTRRGFALEEVWSTSDAVLAHSSLPAPYRRHGAFFVSSVAAFVPSIVTRIGPTGQQTLRVGNQEVPLFMAGTGARVTISLRSGFLPAPFRH
jgi:hypothetical protein